MRAWQKAYERSAREGITAPLAPAYVVVEGGVATCSACDQTMPATHTAVQAHGYSCPVDRWPLSTLRASV